MWRGMAHQKHFMLFYLEMSYVYVRSVNIFIRM